MIIPPMIAKLSDKTGGLKVNSKLKLMVDVNGDIKELNCRQRQGNYPVRLSPQFHTWGMTGGKILSDHPRNILEGQDYHRSAQWREETRAKMLHLDDKCRLRMGKACINYYKALYKITPCLAPTKNEGLRLQAEEERAQARAWRRAGMRGAALRSAGRHYMSGAGGRGAGGHCSIGQRTARGRGAGGRGSGGRGALNQSQCIHQERGTAFAAGSTGPSTGRAPRSSVSCSRCRQRRRRAPRGATTVR